MDDRPRVFPSDPNETRRWMGRLLVAVVVGEGIWNLIVSLMNNVVVPWLGDVMGQSSGLPTSFTQRPYDYPDLFVAVIELCLAGLVAVGINAFFQRPQRNKVRVQKRPATPVAVPVMPTPVIASASPIEQRAVTVPPPSQPVFSTPVTAQAPRPAPAPAVESKPVPVVEPVPVPRVDSRPVAPPVIQPAPVITPKPVLAPAPIPAAVKPAPPPPAPVKAKPKKVYYNSVGEAIEFDDD